MYDLQSEWERFFLSGKIDDYLKYAQHKNSELNAKSEVGQYADKDTRNNTKTT